MKTQDALRQAQERDLDLVEVAAEAKPPVCRILDYSKYKYEQNQKQKAARKHQTQINVREIKFRPKIAQHDYDTKKGHVERFLKARDKVKVTIMFRGREMAHPERGEMILNRLAEDLGELATVEQRPQQDGRNMTMMLAPARVDHDDHAAAAAEAEKTKQRKQPQQKPAGRPSRPTSTRSRSSAAPRAVGSARGPLPPLAVDPAPPERDAPPRAPRPYPLPDGAPGADGGARAASPRCCREIAGEGAVDLSAGAHTQLDALAYGDQSAEAIVSVLGVALAPRLKTRRPRACGCCARAGCWRSRRRRRARSSPARC